MADKRIDQLDDTATALAGSDLLVVQVTGDSTTKKITVDNAQLSLVDADAVANAGAVMGTDFGGSALGRLVRTGSGTYAVIKDNLAAGGVPTVNDDAAAGYEPGSLWITGAAVYVLMDATTGFATWHRVWQKTTATPAAVGAAGVVGTSATLSPADHVHAHGSQTDETMHALATPAAAGFAPPGTPITESTTSRTLADADHGRVILCTHASGCAVTVPDTVTPGLVVMLVQRGAAQVTITGSGTMVVTPASTFATATNEAKTAEVGSVATVIVESATVCNVVGDLEAA